MIERTNNREREKRGGQDVKRKGTVKKDDVSVRVLTGA